MLDTLYSLPFLVLEPPNLKLKKPAWVQKPSAMTVFSFVLLSYFLVTGGELAVLLHDLAIADHSLFSRYHI